MPNHQIINNLVIVQEVIHSMNTKTGKKGFYAVKVDIEKAYDRLNWDFIKETLLLAGLPIAFVQLFMDCITTVSFSMFIMVRLLLISLLLEGSTKVIRCRLIFLICVWRD